jgi:hypothetical protein
MRSGLVASAFGDTVLAVLRGDDLVVILFENHLFHHEDGFRIIDQQNPS